MRIDTLCKSLCGNNIYCLTITNDLQMDYMSREEEREKFQIFEYDKGGCIKTVMREKKAVVKKPKKKEVTITNTPSTQASGTGQTTVITKKKKASSMKKGTAEQSP